MCPARGTGTPAGREAEAVVARRIHKQYRLGDTTVAALRGVDLELPAGHFIVLLGPSGSGKTTLLNLIGGLDTPTSGELTVLGTSLGGLNEEQLTAFRREVVGFVFQMFNLVPTLTALENVQLVGELVGRGDGALAVLESVGLAPQANQTPAQLSGGEQQRVAIARALVKQPKLLLADEPTGALDAETGREVLALLWAETRRRGLTVITVSHNSALAAMGDVIVRLRSGCITESGLNEQPANPRDLKW